MKPEDQYLVDMGIEVPEEEPEEPEEEDKAWLLIPKRESRAMPKGKPLVETRTLRVLYLYCGSKRRADLREWLEKLVALDPAFEAISDVHITEVDTLLDPIQSDLGDTEIQDKYLGEVRNGQFHLTIMSPPCGSWTRIVWTNTLGPTAVPHPRMPLGLRMGQAGRVQQSARRKRTHSVLHQGHRT